MKLEKFKQNSKQKKIMIGSIIALILLVGGITLYRTFALYEEKKEFNVLKGRVPNFIESDVSLAFVVDGVASEKVPARGNYKVDVTCDGGYGEWNYTAWDIVVRSFTNGTKCDLKFTSVTEEEMPEYKTIKKMLKSSPISLYKKDATGTEKYRRSAAFDFSEIPGYENFTVDNFVSYMNIQFSVGSGTGWFYGYSTSVDNYDPNTGIVTVSYIYTTKHLSLNADRDYTELCVEVFYY